MSAFLFSPPHINVPLPLLSPPPTSACLSRSSSSSSCIRSRPADAASASRLAAASLPEAASASRLAAFAASRPSAASRFRPRLSASNFTTSSESRTHSSMLLRRRP